MNNLFKKGFASLALASAMTTGIFADSVAYIDVKLGQVFASTENGKDGNVTAFKMHIKKGKIVATFDKDANSAATIKLAVNKRVAGDGIKGANIVFKQATASGENLMPSNLDKKIAKLTFAINQVDKANVLIISAASKKDFENATPFNVAMNRKGAKMHLFVTRDTTGLKKILHLFANNIKWDQWNKEKMILGNSSFKKQKPQVNLYSDATESATDENMTNANLLINNDGKGSEAGKGVMFKSNLLTAVNNIIPNVATTNTNQRKIVFEPNYEHLVFNFGTTIIRTDKDNKITLTPYHNLAFNFSGATVGQKSKITLEPHTKQLAFGYGTASGSDKDSKIILEPYTKHLAFNFNRATASDPEDAKITFEPYNKHLAFNLGATITSDPKDAKVLFEQLAFNIGITTGSDKNKIILETYNLGALNKSLFDSDFKTDYGALSASMAA